MFVLKLHFIIYSQCHSIILHQIKRDSEKTLPYANWHLIIFITKSEEVHSIFLFKHVSYACIDI